MSSEPVPRTHSLVVRKRIKASAQRLFEAWTEPAHVRAWWGPKSVVCTGVEIDLRVGGAYRIANQFPDGTTVWIVGHFEVIAPPRLLVYSWRIESQTESPERVTVRFEPANEGTDVVVVHERIASVDKRDLHHIGWDGCLAGLLRYLQDEE